MSFDETRTVVTPEQVSVTYTLAGVGTRFAATLLDTCIQGAVAGVILLALAALAAEGPFEVLAPLEQTASAWVLALVVIAVFAVIWGYFIFWETIWNGQTPGKRAAGIRVLRDGGYPLDFRAAFVRNVARYVDFLPVLYGVGAFTMFLSRDSKRLGDYAAGTIVVVDSRPVRRLRPAPAFNSPAPAPAPQAYPLLGDLSALNLRGITREQFAVLDRFLTRRLDLSENVRAEMARKIALPLIAIIGMEPPVGDPYPYETFLAELAAAYRSRAAG